MLRCRWGRRPESQQREFSVRTVSLPEATRRVLYDRLISVPGESGFDSFVGTHCEPHCQQAGRPSIPARLYLQILFVGYLEHNNSQRRFTWRWADSLSLRKVLGIAISDSTPDHSSLPKICQRLQVIVRERVFAFVLRIAVETVLLNFKSVGMDSTTLEANAAMRSIVCKDDIDDWKEYCRKPAEAVGESVGNDEDFRSFDQQGMKERKKTVSNNGWQSPNDPDSSFMKMKDSHAYLGYKAEHVTDLHMKFVSQATGCHGMTADPQTIMSSVLEAQVQLDNCVAEVTTAEAGPNVIEEPAADNRYHSSDAFMACVDFDIRTYISEGEGDKFKWEDKEQGMKEVFHGNRPRRKRSKGKALQKRRSDFKKCGFAHICEAGGSRRTLLRGLDNIRKRCLVEVAGHKLALITAAYSEADNRGPSRSLTAFSLRPPCHCGDSAASQMHLETRSSPTSRLGVKL